MYDESMYTKFSAEIYHASDDKSTVFVAINLNDLIYFPGNQPETHTARFKIYYELFNNYGEVKSINIIEGKGFGFVEMGTADEAEKAKEALNGTDFKGRTMRIDEARPARNRERRGGGGGGFQDRY